MARSAKVQRFGLIGDIHCEDEQLARVLDHLSGLGVDALLTVGDIADGYGDLARTTALLQSAGVVAVAGNHDRWLLSGAFRCLPQAMAPEALGVAERHYLESLPKTRLFDTVRGRVLLCHGFGEDDEAGLRPEEPDPKRGEKPALDRLLAEPIARYVVNGHTHRPMLRTIGALTVLNAGTLHRNYRPVCMLADFGSAEVQVFDVEPDRISVRETWRLDD